MDALTRGASFGDLGGDVVFPETPKDPRSPPTFVLAASSCSSPDPSASLRPRNPVAPHFRKSEGIERLRKREGLRPRRRVRDSRTRRPHGVFVSNEYPANLTAGDLARFFAFPTLVRIHRVVFVSPEIGRLR